VNAKIKTQKTQINKPFSQGQERTKPHGLAQFMEMIRYELKISFWQGAALSLTLFVLTLFITIVTFSIK
jgi:hypothetical protein